MNNDTTVRCDYCGNETGINYHPGSVFYVFYIKKSE